MLAAAACGGLGFVAGWTLKPAVEPPKPAPVERLSLRAARFSDLPGWAEDSLAAAVPALRRSCARLLPLPAARPMGRDGLAGTVADW